MTATKAGGAANDNDTPNPCKNAEIASRDIQAAYLSMKKEKESLEKRIYEESMLLFVDRDGQVVGWTEAAARLFKHPRLSPLRKNVRDFLQITDGRSFGDIFALVRPGFPYTIQVFFNDGPGKKPVYTVKVSSFIFEGRDLLYFVFYRS